MYGKIYKKEDTDGKVVIYISFGGLLLKATGTPVIPFFQIEQ